MEVRIADVIGCFEGIDDVRATLPVSYQKTSFGFFVCGDPPDGEALADDVQRGPCGTLIFGGLSAEWDELPGELAPFLQNGWGNLHIHIFDGLLIPSRLRRSREGVLTPTVNLKHTPLVKWFVRYVGGPREAAGQ